MIWQIQGLQSSSSRRFLVSRAVAIYLPTCRREAEFEKGNDVPLTLENARDESFFNCIVEVCT